MEIVIPHCKEWIDAIKQMKNASSEITFVVETDAIKLQTYTVDNSTFITHEQKTESEETFEGSFSSDEFFKVFKNLKKDSVIMITDTTVLCVKHKKRMYKLPSKELFGDKFPNIDKITPEASFTVKIEVLKTTIKDMQSFIGNKEGTFEIAYVAGVVMVKNVDGGKEFLDQIEIEEATKKKSVNGLFNMELFMNAFPEKGVVTFMFDKEYPAKVVQESDGWKTTSVLAQRLKYE